MSRRKPIATLTIMSVTLVLGVGDVAYGQSPKAKTTDAPTAPQLPATDLGVPAWAALVGHYTYVGHDSEQATVLAEVDAAVDNMNFFVRLWAKPKLVGANRIPRWLRLGNMDAPTWEFETALSPQWRGKPDGNLFAVANEEGDSLQMRWRLNGATFVQEYVKEGKVTRVVTFALSSDRTHLSMTVVSPKTEVLSRMRYTLTYKRTSS